VAFYDAPAWLTADHTAADDFTQEYIEVTVEEVGTLTNPVGTLAAARAASALRIPAAAS